MHQQRRDKIRRLLKDKRLDGLLVTNFTNVTYLTGFTGDDSFLWIGQKNDLLLTDPRYTTQLADECPELELAVRAPGVKMPEFTAKTLTKAKAAKVGFEADSLVVATRDKFGTELPKAELVATSGWVESLRMIKDKGEIDRTRRACEQARRSFEVVRATLTPDMSEAEAAADLEHQARRFGAKGLSFTPIVGVGERSALPHGRPTNRKIGTGEFTLFDWGVNEGLYMSDLTRVLATSKISPKLRKLYGVVLKAQLAGIAAVRPGAACQDVDAAARAVIERAGFGKQFGHGLGHGIGLEIHEAPRLAPGQDVILQSGMIVTVEPGIYFPDWGGIRIEDDVLVTRTGHEVLSEVPKELDECVVG